MDKQTYIDSKRQLAYDGFLDGHGCAQSVLQAFAEETGLDTALLYKLGSGLGGGLARQREVCGTVTALTLLVGLFSSDGSGSKTDKDAVYARVRALCDKFREKNGSIVCRELLAGVKVPLGVTSEERTREYYKKRPCPQYCADAAGIVAQWIYDEGLTCNKK